MRISQLLQGIQTSGTWKDTEGEFVPTQDSRRAGAQSLFFAVPGVLHDGHAFVQEVLAKGCPAVVVERDLGLPNQILVADTHLAYSMACANYFGNPARKLTLLGVTGTNGKTTVTYILRHLLAHAGKKAGVIGSVQNIIGDMIVPAKYTTPEAFQLHSLFARMVQAGCEYAIMEVSSHALAQKRVQGLTFVAGAFTNLTQDHLDYHGTMENYFSAKKRLFEVAGIPVINSDDPKGKELLAQYPAGISFSTMDSKATLYARDISFSDKGSDFTLTYESAEAKIHYTQPGLFSVSNAMTAAGLALAVGISWADVTAGLSTSVGVPGRFERIPLPADYTVIRDFAHSADGLEKLLETARKLATGRVITVFGCAGQRDRNKRPAMAAAAARYSDLCIITSDNPRQEPEMQIIDDALPGFLAYPKVPYKIIPDRLTAIRWALEQCQAGDLLLLAGKGHEDYQVLDYGTVYFDEREIVTQLGS